MVDFVLKIHQKWTNFEFKTGHISKTKKLKNRKIDFSSVDFYTSYQGCAPRPCML